MHGLLTVVYVVLSNVHKSGINGFHRSRITVCAMCMWFLIKCSQSSKSIVKESILPNRKLMLIMSYFPFILNTSLRLPNSFVFIMVSHR